MVVVLCGWRGFVGVDEVGRSFAGCALVRSLELSVSGFGEVFEIFQIFKWKGPHRWQQEGIIAGYVPAFKKFPNYKVVPFGFACCWRTAPSRVLYLIGANNAEK